MMMLKIKKIVFFYKKYMFEWKMIEIVWLDKKIDKKENWIWD